MDFKELNETLQKFLEGDVVSFNAFKRNKMAQQRKQRNQEFVDKYGDELQKSLDTWNKTNVMVEIQKIKVLDCEGPIKEPYYQPGEEFSYENFQKDLYARDYINGLKEVYDKCNIEVTCLVGKETKTYKMRVTIGAGKEECNVYHLLELYVQKDTNKTPLIQNDEEPYELNYYKQLAKEYQVTKTEEPEEVNPLQKDYSKDGTKLGAEVEVGDIITCTWGYSMVLVDFYKVIDKKKASIRLQHLETKPVEGGQGRGTLVPIDTPKEDSEVDGKLFRIGVKWDKKVVCKIKGHYAAYWDGKPKYYDTWD